MELPCVRGALRLRVGSLGTKTFGWSCAVRWSLWITRCAVVAFQPSVTLFLQDEQGVFRPASRGINPCRSIIYYQSTTHSGPMR
jgi:hypothetical protein